MRNALLPLPLVLLFLVAGPPRRLLPPRRPLRAGHRSSRSSSGLSPSVVDISADRSCGKSIRSSATSSAAARRAEPVPRLRVDRRSFGTGGDQRARHRRRLADPHHPARRPRARGDVLGSDRDADLAVLEVAAARKGLPATPLRQERHLLIGETVVGDPQPVRSHPHGDDGVLSARGRSVGGSGARSCLPTSCQPTLRSTRGTPAALVNLDGQVIGINTAIIQGAWESASPFRRPGAARRRRPAALRRAAAHLARHAPGDDRSRARGARSYPVAHGVLVDRVDDGSPAARAGIVAGDLLTAVDSRPVAAREDLSTAYYFGAAGDAAAPRAQARQGDTQVRGGGDPAAAAGRIARVAGALRRLARRAPARAPWSWSAWRRVRRPSIAASIREMSCWARTATRSPMRRRSGAKSCAASTAAASSSSSSVAASPTT